MSAMRLILIRHGLTAANEAHLYCGSTDLPLSPAGRAALLARRAVVAYPSAVGCRVLTSGMRRCEETLDILYGFCPHERVSAFREMDFGAFEMRAYEQLKDDPRYQRWISGDNERNIAPGGESGAQMTDRLLTALKAVLARGQDALLVTHGGVIAAILADLFPQEQKNRYQWQPEPGGGYEVFPSQQRYRRF